MKNKPHDRKRKTKGKPPDDNTVSENKLKNGTSQGKEKALEEHSMEEITVVVSEKNVDIIVDEKKNSYPPYKGLQQLAWLLANPDREIQCTMLIADNPLSIWEAERKMKVQPHIYSEDGDVTGEYTSFDRFENCPVMDSRYMNELKREINKVIRELAVAEEYNDIGAIEAKNEELNTLTAFLKRVTNPDGKSKWFRNELYKSKDSLRKSLNKAIEIIGEKNAELMCHLRKNVRIGNYCCYHSQPGIEVIVIYEKRRLTMPSPLRVCEVL